jgi:hypothetical protein
MAIVENLTVTFEGNWDQWVTTHNPAMYQFTQNPGNNIDSDQGYEECDHTIPNLAGYGTDYIIAESTEAYQIIVKGDYIYLTYTAGDFVNGLFGRCTARSNEYIITDIPYDGVDQACFVYVIRYDYKIEVEIKNQIGPYHPASLGFGPTYHYKTANFGETQATLKLNDVFLACMDETQSQNNLPRRKDRLDEAPSTLGNDGSRFTQVTLRHRELYLEPDADGNLVQYIGDWSAGNTYYLTRSNFPYQYKQEVDQPLIKPFLASSTAWGSANNVETTIQNLGADFLYLGGIGREDRTRKINFENVEAGGFPGVQDKVGWIFDSRGRLAYVEKGLYTGDILNFDSINFSIPGVLEIFLKPGFLLNSTPGYSISFVCRIDGNSFSNFISFRDELLDHEFRFLQQSFLFIDNLFTVNTGANRLAGSIFYNTLVVNGTNVTLYSQNSAVAVYSTSIPSLDTTFPLNQIRMGISTDVICKVAAIAIFPGVALTGANHQTIYNQLNPIYGNI